VQCLVDEQTEFERDYRSYQIVTLSKIVHQVQFSNLLTVD